MAMVLTTYDHEISLWRQGQEQDDAEYLVPVVKSARMMMVHYQNARLFEFTRET